MKQLKDDITELFSNSENIRVYYEEYNDEYDEIITKEAYEKLPEINYPLITIEEIDNRNNNRFWDGKEFATALGYQFTINCEQTENYTANENVRIIQMIIDNYIQNSKYNCFRRVSATAPIPVVDDPNIRMGTLRYDCNLVASEHTIYRRY